MNTYKLSKQCLEVIKKDIKSARNYGMDCDKTQWERLLNKIEER